MQEDQQQEPKAPLDWFLQDLVALCNTTTSTIPVTLTVGGALISGRLISGKKYFDSLSKVVSSAVVDSTDEHRQAIEEYFRRPGAIYDPQEPMTPEQERLRDLPVFVHLEGAKIFYPGQPPIPAGPGVLWRGRLEAVDGFHYGLLQVG